MRSAQSGSEANSARQPARPSQVKKAMQSAILLGKVEGTELRDDVPYQDEQTAQTQRDGDYTAS